jgi:hypothetical protein
VGRGLDEASDRTGVPEDPLELLGRRGLVDGHRHAAEVPHGEVHESPLIAGLAHETDTVPGADACRDESLGQPRHIGEEVPTRHVSPGVAPTPPEDHLVGGFRRVGDRDVGQVAGTGLLHQDRRGVLVHRGHSSTGEIKVLRVR